MKKFFVKTLALTLAATACLGLASCNPVEEDYYVKGVVTYDESMNGNDNYLVLATDAPFAPWEYNVGQNWAGIDIEIGALIAERLGKTLAVKQTAFDTICMAVDNGDADLGLAGLTITEARKNTVNFSIPYYTEAYQVVIVKATDTTFDACTTTADVENVLAAYPNGTKAGSQKGTTGAKYIQGDQADVDGFGFVGYSNLDLTLYDTHADAVRDMANGALSFCIVDNLVALEIVEQINAATTDESGKVKMIDIALSQESYGIAVKKNDATLLETVNAVLTEKAERIQEIIAFYSNMNFEE